MGRRRGIWFVGALALTTTAACSSDEATTATTETPIATTAAPASTAATDVAPLGSGPTTADPTTVSPPATTSPATTTTAPQLTDDIVAGLDHDLGAEPEGCDPLDTRSCLLPFPSNAYRTSGRVALPSAGMPANASGVAIDPAEWNRNDGFSPNTPILTFVSGLDAEASSLPSWTDLESSLADDATVVLVDVDTGERVPLWAEVDAKAKSDDDRLLEIHPVVSLPEGHTFAVGLRNLVRVDGSPVPPSTLFSVYRDGISTGDPRVENRREEMETTFDALAAAGVDRSELFLAWDFTVASTENISGRMLHIRDDALAQLGDASPAFTITSVTPNTDDNIALQIDGTYTVPNYLTANGGPGTRFNYGLVDLAANPDALPVQNGTTEAGFRCNVSVATMTGSTPAHLVEYGHGLLGSFDEIDAGNVRGFANEHNVVFCATKWAGMSEDDIGNAAATLGDFSNFPTMADRLQQGVLNQIFLGRLMTRPDGLVSLPQLQFTDGSPMIDTAHLDYDGNSQGGIMGLMLTAVSPDIERSVLGVMGMNYSVLLSRSVDFATYEAIFAPAYPNDLDRVLILAMAQMLWDRGEGAGYVQHVTDDPYPGTPAKDVLLHVAFGDWQVSELTAMIAARTMHVPISRPVAAAGRSEEVTPGWGLSDLVYPSTGSGLVVWDSGSDPIPVPNVPPSTGRDPHEDPRADPDVRTQKAAFLFDDTLLDVCDGGPCAADPRD